MWAVRVIIIRPMPFIALHKTFSSLSLSIPDVFPFQFHCDFISFHFIWVYRLWPFDQCRQFNEAHPELASRKARKQRSRKKKREKSSSIFLHQSPGDRYIEGPRQTALAQFNWVDRLRNVSKSALGSTKREGGLV